MAIEGVNESSDTRVYKRIIAELATNPVLEAVGVEWIAHDGTADVIRPCVVDSPVIVLRPRLGAARRRGPEGWVGDLVVDIDMFVPNTQDACDCMDLWSAFVDALFAWDEREKQKAFKRDLRGDRCGQGGPCDAETGEINIDQPATIDPAFENDDFVYFHCRGSISIRVLRTINP